MRVSQASPLTAPMSVCVSYARRHVGPKDALLQQQKRVHPKVYSRLHLFSRMID